MRINDELITELEALAKIRLSDSEKEQVKAELGEMLAYVDVLNGLDTAGVPPLSHTVQPLCRLREDVTAPSLTAAEVTEGAPQKQGDLFSVPKAFE